MGDKKWPYRWVLLLILMLPTLIVLLLQYWFSLDRALFVYEYFLIGFLMAFNVRSVWPWFAFVFVIALDIATMFSKLFLFNLSDFFNTFKYFSNYSFSPVQIFFFFTIIFVLIGLLFLFRLIKRKIGYDKVCLSIFASILSITFALDNINGSSFVLAHHPFLHFQKNNFAASTSKMLYHSLFNRNFSADVPKLFLLNKESIVFHEYASDSTSNQMLIIVESFGMINDSLKREKFQNEISDVFEGKNWKTSWGKTPFKGSTTNAELRELLNCVGDYRYFNKPRQAKNLKSIFQIKNQQGYHTKAIHSYKANMFERKTWWNNIGADEVFFSEDVLIANNFQNKLNYESPFTSVNDEDAFNFIQSKTAKKGNQFVYILTENAHLPFKGKLKKSNYIKYFDVDKEANLSDEAKNQNKRIMNFLAYVAIHLDPNKFQKLLIVGDHMPPFLKKSDRSFYSDQYVPYCIVTR